MLEIALDGLMTEADRVVIHTAILIIPNSALRNLEHPIENGYIQ